MKSTLKIGIAYDVKEDYKLEAEDWKYSDFSTLAEIQYAKGLFEARGHTVVLLGNYEKIYQALKNDRLPDVDIVFNTAEGIGSRNREGWIPSLLEMNGIPFSGSDAFALSLSLSKFHTKLVAEYLNIPTPEFCEIKDANDIEQVLQIPRPWIIKPNYEGSSSGVFYSDDFRLLTEQAVHLLKEYHQSLICEHYIAGREANVSILYDGEKTKVLGAVEVIRKNGSPLHIFSARDKFSGTCTKINACFPQDTLDLMYKSAVKLHRHLGCKDYNRADFRMDADGRPYFLELNPAPGVSEDDSFTLCCKCHGFDPSWVLEQIVYNAIERVASQEFIHKNED